MADHHTKSSMSFGLQKIRFDRVSTVALYRRKITTPGANQCTCISCKNFAAQRRKMYPKVFLHILRELGVNPLREWEAFDYDFGLEKHQHLYGGWFPFCGELIDPLEEQPGAEDQPFEFWFTTKFPADTLRLSEELCAVEFLASVPWILPRQSKEGPNLSQIV